MKITKTTIIAASLLLLAGMIFVGIRETVAAPKTVCQQVGTCNYTTITACLNALSANGTCLVQDSGTYSMTNYFSNKVGITLQADVGYEPTIDAGGNQYCFEGTGNNQTIDGVDCTNFGNKTIGRDGYFFAAGVKGFTIKNLKIHDGWGEGIKAQNNIGPNLIDNVEIYNLLEIVTGDPKTWARSNGVVTIQWLDMTPTLFQIGDSIKVTGTSIGINSTTIASTTAFTVCGPPTTGCVTPDLTQMSFLQAGIDDNSSVAAGFVRLNGSAGDDAHGISISGATSTLATFADGITVSNCFIHDNGQDGMDIHGQYITVHDCKIWDNEDSAFNHRDGIAFVKTTGNGITDVQHARIYNNNIRNALQGIFVEGGPANDTKDIVLWNNTVYCNGANIHGFTCNQNSTTGIVLVNPGDVSIYGNTLWGVRGLSVTCTTACASTSTVAQNNIFQDSSAALITDPGTATNNVFATPSSLDYNQYASGTSLYIKYNNLFYATAAAFNATTGFEAHGLDKNPSFISTATSSENFALAADQIGGKTLASPYNLDTNGVTRGLDGTWEFGAFEYVPKFIGVSVPKGGFDIVGGRLDIPN